jgi:hypothetical protein
MKKYACVLITLLAFWSAVPAVRADAAPRPLRLDNRSCQPPAGAIAIGSLFLMNLPEGAPLPSPTELAAVAICNCTKLPAPPSCPATICPSICRNVTCLSTSSCLNGVCP